MAALGSQEGLRPGHAGAPHLGLASLYSGRQLWIPSKLPKVSNLWLPARVALLAVHETLTHFARGVTPNLHPTYDRLLAFAQSLGSVEVARSYGEWADLDARRAVHAAGLEPTLSPVLRTATDQVGKRVTAAHMVVDGLDLLWQQSLEALVLATHDPEIAPFMLAAKRPGRAGCPCHRPGHSGLLREVADAV